MRKENTLNFSPLDTEQENSSPSSFLGLIQGNTSHLSSLVIGQENVHLLSCSNLSPSSCSNLPHLSSSDLIGGSIKDEGSINILSQTNKDYINMDITLNGFSGLCQRMTNREASSLCTTQGNTSHLSSSDLIGGSIKDEVGITLSNLSQTKKSDIPSNNLLQPKERNSNNLSQRKGYTMNPTILPQQNDFNTNPNDLPQQKEYNSLSNNLPKKKGYNMKQPNLSQSGRSMVEMLGTLAILLVFCLSEASWDTLMAWTNGAPMKQSKILIYDASIY